MAMHGKNRHYRWSEIQLRHWLETAEKREARDAPVTSRATYSGQFACY